MGGIFESVYFLNSIECEVIHQPPNSQPCVNPVKVSILVSQLSHSIEFNKQIELGAVSYPL